MSTLINGRPTHIHRIERYYGTDDGRVKFDAADFAATIKAAQAKGLIPMPLPMERHEVRPHKTHAKVYEPFPCVICQTVFERYVHKGARIRQTCSDACMSKLRSIQASAKYRRTDVEKPCEACGVVFSGQPEKRFCSPKCKQALLRRGQLQRRASVKPTS